MSKKDVAFLCVDLQNDFSKPGGTQYLPRSSVDFIEGELFPRFRRSTLRISEIISDYRQPRPGDDRECCKPGEWGYLSLIPEDLRKGDAWIKSMNSPVWVRDGIGDPDIVPGEPYPDPVRFDSWVRENIGDKDDIEMVIVFGLTADCCVLSTVQELRWRGFEVRVLAEATDVRSGDMVEKEQFLNRPPFTFWGSTVSWSEFLDIL